MAGSSSGYTKDSVPSPLTYQWRIDISPALREEFCKTVVDQLSEFNKLLPAGARFLGVYETVVGRGPLPPIQIWFEFPSLASFDELATQEAIRNFHKALSKYVDPNFRPWNEMSRRLF